MSKYFFFLYLSETLALICCLSFFSPSQESQKIFKARYGMEADAIKAKLSGFGMQILEDIDPDPENYVCAGIIYTRSMNIGVLSRLEPNKQAMVSFNFYSTLHLLLTPPVFLLHCQMFRLTVRSNKDTVSQTICELLYEQF